MLLTEGREGEVNKRSKHSECNGQRNKQIWGRGDKRTRERRIFNRRAFTEEFDDRFGDITPHSPAQRQTVRAGVMTEQEEIDGASKLEAVRHLFRDVGGPDIEVFHRLFKWINHVDGEIVLGILILRTRQGGR